MAHSDHGRSATSGGPRDDDSLRLPILVGFTGRREFSKDALENARLLDIVAARFCRLVQWLDRELPLTPKLLICGGDAGADLAVATAVLAGSPDNPKHPLWSVALVTAFAGYAPDDATVDAYAELKAAQPGRIATRRLRHLLAHHVEDTEPDEAERVREHAPGPVASEEERDHFRSGHFEQHALWLARYATLLIAASAAGAAVLGAAKPGATARAVAYRRAAVPDNYGAAVIERSQELLAGSPLDEPDGGHVLWIDPTAHDNWPDNLFPLEVLRPIQEIFDQREALPSQAEARDAIYQEPFKQFRPFLSDGQKAADNPAAALQGALLVAGKFEGLYRRQIPLHRRWFSTHTGKAPMFSDEPPHMFLKRLRDGEAPIGRQQLFEHGVVRWSLRALIALFLLAVLFYESYLELQPLTEAWLILYVIVLLLIFIIAFWVTEIDAARLTEDLRGLREVLRVQVAWWASGLELMVDRVHLRRIDSDLKIIRELAATVSMWAMLRTSSGIPVGTHDFSEASTWIDEQVKYHRRRWVSNEGFKQLSQQGSNIGLRAAWLSLLLLYFTRTFLLFLLGPNSFSPLSATVALAVWVIFAITATADFTRQFTYWRPSLQWPTGRWHAVTVAAIAVAALAVLVTPVVGGALLPERWQSPALALVAALFVLALVAFWVARMEWTTAKWRVTKMSDLQQTRCVVATSGSLIGFAAILAPAMPSIGNETPSLTNPDILFTFRALVLAATTLLLAASGMLRYYVDRRNHAAQATQSDDCLRAFLRAQAILNGAQQALRTQHDDRQALREARRSIIQIGKLALDENESWLRAHRERPVEAISGA